MFFHPLPNTQKEFQSQIGISEISADEKESLLEPVSFSHLHYFLQSICFFLFLGPVRLCLAICVLLFEYVAVSLISFIGKFLVPSKFLRKVCYNIFRFGVRSILFCSGIVLIQKRGTIEQNSRFIISNHTSILDYLLISSLYHVRWIFSDDFYFSSCFQWMEPIIYGKEKISKIMSKAADNFELPPILFFPESSTCAKGKHVLKFSSAPFSTPYKVQILSITYLVLSPFKAEIVATYGRNFWEIVFTFLSFPPTIVHVQHVQNVTMENEGKSSVKDFTETSQLILANSLGISGIDYRVKNK